MTTTIAIRNQKGGVAKTTTGLSVENPSHFAPGSRGAQQCRALAEELMNHG